MPLTPVSTGQAGVPANVNQFIDLLTGVMTDQLTKLLNLFILKARGAAPSAPAATVAAGGSVDIGAHTYAVTFVDIAGGETALGASVGATTTTGNQTVNLSAIALGPTGTASRRVYRTKVGGSTYFLVTTIANNSATTYADAATDASLTAITTPDVFHGSFGGLSVQDAAGTRQAAIMTDGAVLGQALYAADGGPGHVAVFDNGLGTIRIPRIYLGTTDPATYTTVNEGDIWLKG